VSETAKILVVDDEPPVIELLREILTAEGYEVDAAANGEQALERVRERIYDVAILDIGLPDTDGLMLHHRIREMDDELAAHTIFISGLDQSEDNLGYFDAHSSGFLSKPFDVDSVLGAVRAALS
jgi:DNA-binding response OmpR family regulator